MRLLVHNTVGGAIALSCVLGVGLLGCSQGGKAPSSEHPQAPGAAQDGTAADPVVTRVKILADGKLLVDDQPCELKDFGAKLDKVAAARGKILYERENKGEKPPATAKAAIDMIIMRQIPISMPGGHSMPRIPASKEHPGMPAGHSPLPESAEKTSHGKGEAPKKPAHGSETKPVAKDAATEEAHGQDM